MMKYKVRFTSNILSRSFETSDLKIAPSYFFGNARLRHEPLALDTLLEPVFCKSETSRDIKKS